MSPNGGRRRPGAVRPIHFLGALVMIGGLGAGPVQAAPLATTKNFVPAPNTPSYFANEGAPSGDQSGTSPAAPQRKEAERDVPRRSAEAHRKAERDVQARQKIAASQAVRQPAALPPPAKPPAPGRDKQAVPKPPPPAAAPRIKTAARPAAPAMPRPLAGIGHAAPTRPLAARDGLPRTTSDLGTAAIATALVALGFLRQRRRRPDAAAPDGRARAADLNALLRGLEAKIRRTLPRRTPFRLSLLPELWPCRTDQRAIAAAIIDLAGAAAAGLASGGSVVVGTRNFRVDADHAAASPGAVPGDYVRLTLRENGRSLSETAFAQIFDPLATVCPAIVRASDMARRLGGFVRVETAEGVGTAVHLYFRPVVAALSPV